MKTLNEKFRNVVLLLPQGNWSVALLLVNLLAVLLILVLKNLLPPIIPLFYGRPYGAEQLAAQGSLVIPPLVAFAVCVVNIAISLSVSDEFLDKVLFGGMFVSTLLSLVTVAKIIFLVGNI